MLKFKYRQILIHKLSYRFGIILTKYEIAKYIFWKCSKLWMTLMITTINSWCLMTIYRSCKFESDTSSCNCGEDSTSVALVLVVSVFVGPLNVYLWFKCFTSTWRYAHTLSPLLHIYHYYYYYIDCWDWPEEDSSNLGLRSTVHCSIYELA